MDHAYVVPPCRLLEGGISAVPVALRGSKVQISFRGAEEPHDGPQSIASGEREGRVSSTVGNVHIRAGVAEDLSRMRCVILALNRKGDEVERSACPHGIDVFLAFTIRIREGIQEQIHRPRTHARKCQVQRGVSEALIRICRKAQEALQLRHVALECGVPQVLSRLFDGSVWNLYEAQPQRLVKGRQLKVIPLKSAFVKDPLLIFADTKDVLHPLLHFAHSRRDILELQQTSSRQSGYDRPGSHFPQRLCWQAARKRRIPEGQRVA